MATRADWAGRVSRWKRSRLGATAFGAREGVDPKQLTWWKWHLKTTSRPAEPAVGTRSRRSRPKRTRFVPVRLATDDVGGEAGEAHSVRIEIATRTGHTIQIHGQVDPRWLTTVVQSLDGSASTC
jgi:hypothetical protein